MPSVGCPIAGCPYTTPDLDAVIVAALLTTHGTTHTTPLPGLVVDKSARVERVRRPSISPAGSSEDWSYFISRWKDYVTATKVTGRDKIIQLLECCNEHLRKDLTRSSTDTLTDQSEEDVLKAIRLLAVREENIMVARATLNSMHQDHDETIRSFGARLRGQAGVCKYLIDCPGCNVQVNYTEAILKDVLSRGIDDSEIQLDLLGNANQNMSLEEIFRFVEAKEAGKRSASHLLHSQGAEAIRSSYQKNRRSQRSPTQPRTGDNHAQCSYCGRKGHGERSNARRRSTECPAYNHTCKHCNREHHLESMCRSKDNPIPKKRQTEHGER